MHFPSLPSFWRKGTTSTHDVKRYLLRLWLFALISEIPYDLAFQGTLLESGSQNVFFTLGLSLGVLELLGRLHEPAGQVIVLVCGLMIGEWAGVDYGFLGVLLPVIYGRFRESSFGRLCMGGLWNFLWQPGIQYLGVLASVPIGLYRGKQGRKMKYFFYLFYPVHSADPVRDPDLSVDDKGMRRQT